MSIHYLIHHTRILLTSTLVCGKACAVDKSPIFYLKGPGARQVIRDLKDSKNQLTIFLLFYRHS